LLDELADETRFKEKYPEVRISRDGPNVVGHGKQEGT